jgi:translocation and assembly module TamA
VTVTLVERPARFVGFGASFATSEGLALQAFWGHRNLFGEGEQLTIRGSVGRLIENSIGETEYFLGFDFRKPDVGQRTQDLLASFAIERERPEAFDRFAITASVGVERRLDRFTTGTVGLLFEQTEITQRGETDNFTLFGLALSADRNVTDDLLNPTEGYRARLDVTPYIDVNPSSNARQFTRSELTASTYFDFDTVGWTVLATRATVGSVFGAELLDLPANKRFYAGGGGSIRGYDFQSVGPLDEFDDPIGGRSLLEFSVELRQKITESIGIVPFVDGGTVFENTYPDFDETLQFGAGLGFRYYTDFGPVRFDLATPLNPRDRDPVIQFYISIGQAF